MFCSSCGKELPENANFCDGCGTNLADFGLVDGNYTGGESHDERTADETTVLATEDVADETTVLITESSAEGATESGAESAAEDATEFGAESPAEDATGSSGESPAEETPVSNNEVEPEDTSGLSTFPEDYTEVLSMPDNLGEGTAREDTAFENTAKRKMLTRSQKAIIGVVAAVAVAAIGFFAFWFFSPEKSLASDVEALVYSSGVTVFDLPADEVEDALGLSDDLFARDGDAFEISSVELIDSHIPDNTTSENANDVRIVTVGIVLVNSTTEIHGTTTMEFVYIDNTWTSTDSVNIEDPVYIATEAVDDDKVIENLDVIFEVSNLSFNYDSVDPELVSNEFDSDEQTSTVVLLFPFDDGDVQATIVFDFDSESGLWSVYDVSVDDDRSIDALDDDTPLNTYESTGLGLHLQGDANSIAEQLEEDGFELASSSEEEDLAGEGSTWIVRDASELLVDMFEDAQLLVEDDTSETTSSANSSTSSAADTRSNTPVTTDAGDEVSDDAEASYESEVSDEGETDRSATLLLGYNMAVDAADDTEGLSSFTEEELLDGAQPTVLILSVYWDDLLDISEDVDTVAEALIPDGELVSSYSFTDLDQELSSSALVGIIELEGDIYVWCISQLCSVDPDTLELTNSVLRIIHMPADTALSTLSFAYLYDDEELEAVAAAVDLPEDEDDYVDLCELFAQAKVQLDITGTNPYRYNALTGDYEIFDEDSDTWEIVDEEVVQD